MKIKFDFLFEVVFEHEYFKNGIIPDLEIIPTYQTQELLKNYGMLFKKTERGIIILYEIDTAIVAEPPLKPIVSDEIFSFELYMTNPYFSNYSNIPLNHKYPEFFYFNNLDENIVDSKLLLNKQNYSNASDISELASNLFNLEKITASPTSLLEIKDISGTKVFSKTISSQNGTLIYQLDFDKIGTGRFDIFIDGSIYKKIYSDKAVSRKSLFGILDIYKSGQVPLSYQYSSNDGTVNKKTYKIRFARRDTIWKYFVILKNINTDPGLNVSYGAKITGEEIYPDTMAFNSATPDPNLVATYGIGKVLLFESIDKVPLYETPKTNIKLLKPDSADAGSEPDVIIDNLPNASVSAIKTNTANTKPFSEIYIYV